MTVSEEKLQAFRDSCAALGRSYGTNDVEARIRSIQTVERDHGLSVAFNGHGDIEEWDLLRDEAVNRACEVFPGLREAAGEDWFEPDVWPDPHGDLEFEWRTKSELPGEDDREILAHIGEDEGGDFGMHYFTNVGVGSSCDFEVGPEGKIESPEDFMEAFRWLLEAKEGSGE